MSKLSKEQIKNLSSRSYMYSGLQLMCDGQKIKLIEFRSKNRIHATAYVNGHLKGEWLAPYADFPESKFFQFMKVRVKKNPLKPKCRKMEIKILKRRAMDFASIGQALRHLNTVCDSVEVIEGDDQ